jgi:hypothetical protein
METRRRALLVVVAIVSVFLVGRLFVGGNPETPSTPQMSAEATPPPEKGAAAPPQSSPNGPLKLLSHRAVYELKLKSARSNSGISALDGRMVMEWTDSCDGPTLNQRIQTRTYDSDGNSVVTDFRISTWEARDGSSFRFNAHQETDGQAAEEFVGRGVKDDKGVGTVTYTKPPQGTLALGAGTLFPSQHTAAMIRAGLAGKSILMARVFDGSGPDTAYEAVGAIGKEEPLDAGSSTGVGASLLKGIRSWPMRLAYFPVDASDGLPEYEIGFRMYANGVSTDLELDYGDFTVAGLLSQIEALPDPGC